MASQSKPYIQVGIQAGNKNRWIDVLICTLLLIAAITCGLSATISGPGISPDSVTYISMGANLFYGKGFDSNLSNPFDTSSLSPVTLWPPGYSLLIAGLMITGISAVEAAKWAVILCFGLLLGVMYWIAQSLAGRWVGLLSSLAILALMPVIHAATFALSELPFMLFTAGSAAGWMEYVRGKPGRRNLWLVFSAGTTALAILTRYVGLLWVAAGLLVILLDALTTYRLKPKLSQIRKMILSGGIFTLISLAPIFPWFIRNKILTSQFSGFDRLDSYHPSFSQNLSYIIGTLKSELVPSIHIGLRSLFGRPFLMLGFILVILLALLAGIFILRRRYFRPTTMSTRRGKPIFATSQDLTAWSILGIYIGVYLIGMLVLASIMLFPPYDWPRTLVVIYPFLLVFAISPWALLVNQFWAGAPSRSRKLAIALPVLLLILPYGIQSAGFISAAAQGQEYSAPEWRLDPGMQLLAQLAKPGDTIYSDQPAAVSYVLNRPARYLPYTSQIDEFSQMLASQGKISGSSEYFILFKGALGQPDPYFRQRLSSSDFVKLSASINQLKLVSDTSDATIYRLEK